MPDTQFKHIKANPVEDDDIVIVAGAVDEPEREQDLIVESNSEQEREPTPARESTSDPSADTHAAKKIKEYEGTTLDDIEQSKMSTTQIIVIAVALICLAAFIIWYIVFS